MPDQYTAVASMLEKLGIASQWRIVEPAPGGLRDNVWIHNTEQRLSGFVEVSPVDAQFLDEYEMMIKIQMAMIKASFLQGKEQPGSERDKRSVIQCSARRKF